MATNSGRQSGSFFFSFLAVRVLYPYLIFYLYCHVDVTVGLLKPHPGAADDSTQGYDQMTSQETEQQATDECDLTSIAANIDVIDLQLLAVCRAEPLSKSQIGERASVGLNEKSVYIW